MKVKADMADIRQHAMAVHLRAIVDAARTLRGGAQPAVVVAGSQADMERQTGDSATVKAAGEALTQGLKAIVAAEDFIGNAVELAGRPERSFSVMGSLIY